MVRKLAIATLLFVLGSAAALAADISGKWTAHFTTPIGEQNYTYVFQADGSKLTGTINNGTTSVDVKDGKVDGDTLTFVEDMKMGDMEMRIEYTGKVAGDQINFTRKVGDFGTEELVAKRAQ
jgi:hypothetical protein